MKNEKLNRTVGCQTNPSLRDRSAGSDLDKDHSEKKRKKIFGKHHENGTGILRGIHKTQIAAR